MFCDEVVGVSRAASSAKYRRTAAALLGAKTREESIGYCDVVDRAGEWAASLLWLFAGQWQAGNDMHQTPRPTSESTRGAAERKETGGVRGRGNPKRSGIGPLAHSVRHGERKGKGLDSELGHGRDQVEKKHL